MSVTITKTTTGPNPDPAQTIEITVPQELAGHGIAHGVHPEPAVLPELQTILVVGAVTAVLVYALIEALKAGIKKGSKIAGKWWYPSAVRLLALVLGGAIGWILFEPLGGPSSGWPIGAAIGAAAGALDAAVYRLIKRRIKNAEPSKKGG